MAEQIRDSGIDWIGQIPIEWECSKVKFAFELVNGSTPESSDYDCWDGDIRWITPADMTDTGVIASGERNITKYGYNSCGTTLLPKGSVVISTRAPIGKINITSEELCTNQGCKSLTRKGDNRFVYYLLIAGQEKLSMLGRGTTFLELSTYDLKSFGIVLPPDDEQHAIAEFLDNECAQIDSIATDLEKQIELLQQYKKSLITETVTKGLDKSVPMKDSGIEWIGEIPEHWTITRFKDICEQIGDIDHYMPDSVENGIPYVMTGDFIGDENEIDFDGCKKISKEDFKRLSRKIRPLYGDILLARYATIGTVRLVDTHDKFLVSYACAIIRLKNLADPQFVYYYLRSHAYIEEISQYICTNTQANVGLESIGRAKIPVPPIKEQIEISSFLITNCTTIDDLLKVKQKQLDTIYQHKKSLIYEYVTGKKRVKEAQ